MQTHSLDECLSLTRVDVCVCLCPGNRPLEPVCGQGCVREHFIHTQLEGKCIGADMALTDEFPPAIKPTAFNHEPAL